MATDTERAPDRMMDAGGKEGSSDGAAKCRRRSPGDINVPSKVSRCPPLFASVLASTGCTSACALQAAPLCMPLPNTGLATVTIDLFMEVVELAASIPVSAEVERDLAASFQVMRSVQNSKRILKSHRDVNAIRAGRNQNHLKAKADEQFRIELLLDILQYVSNAHQSAALLGSLSCAGEQLERGTVAAASPGPGNLVRWVQERFLPFVRERLPDCMLSPLLTAACNWGGQLQVTPASLGVAAAAPGTSCGGGASMLTAARQQQLSVPEISAGHQLSVPAARRLAFGKFQHLHNRCEKCATECKSARSRFVVQFAVRHGMVSKVLMPTESLGISATRAGRITRERLWCIRAKTSTSASHARRSCCRPLAGNPVRVPIVPLQVLPEVCGRGKE